MDSSSVTIVWITDKPGLSWVEYDVDGEDHFYAKERIKVYDVRHGRRILTDTVHQVRITGLTPDTRYRYRVLTKEVATWSIRNILTYGGTADSGVYKKEPYRFKTFPTTRDSLTFVVYNDIHERAADLKEMSRNIDFDKVDFVVLNGDMRIRSKARIRSAAHSWTPAFPCSPRAFPFLWSAGITRHGGNLPTPICAIFPDGK